MTTTLVQTARGLEATGDSGALERDEVADG
jgi:hypothetical protein